MAIRSQLLIKLADAVLNAIYHNSND